MRLLTVIALGALVIAGPALAEAPPTMKAAHLGWKVAPTAREMARRFPVAAKAADQSRAAVTVNCLSNAFGNLTCEAVEESPAGYGFGEAAVGVLSKARVRSTDAASPEGRRFRFDVKFGDWPKTAKPAAAQQVARSAAPA